MQNSTNPSSTDAPFLDTIATILRHSRRRCAVAVLADEEAPIELEDLVAEAATRERETDGGDATDESMEAVGADFHHVYLPKLAANGIIDYDRETNVVASVRTEDIERIAKLLDDVE